MQDGEAAGQAIDPTAPWTNKAAAVTLYAAWTPTEYIIYYEPNGGTMETTQTAYTIEDAVTFALPTRDGYTFAGWYTDEALTEPAGESFAAGRTGDINLYAAWTAETYTVTFDMNDSEQHPAEGDCPPTTVTYGQAYTLPVPERAQYRFIGWYSDENGEPTQTYWNLAADTELTAHWAYDVYQIKIVTEAGGTAQVIWYTNDGFTETEGYLSYSTAAGIINDMYELFSASEYGYREHYAFEKFQYEDNGSTKCLNAALQYEGEVEAGAVIVLTPEWEQEEHTIYFDMPDGMEGANHIEVLSGSNIESELAKRIPVITGYSFSYWVILNWPGNTSQQGQPFQYVIMPDCTPVVNGDYRAAQGDGSMQLMPVMVAHETLVTLVAYDEHSRPVTLEYDGMIDLWEPSRTGYTFTGWSDGNGKAYANADGEMIRVWDKDVPTATLYAQWEIITYTITYIDGYTHGNPGTFTVETLPITLTNASRSGYRFMGWYGSTEPDAARVTQITTTEDVTLYGRWNRVYTVTFYNDKVLIQTHNLCVGDTFTLPSPMKEHYHGVWNGVANNTTIYADKAFGSVLVLTTAADVRFDVAWSGDVYTIMYVYEYTAYCPTKTYTYGQTTILKEPEGISQSLNIFHGYYIDSNFIYKVTSIAPTHTGRVTIYVKWDIFVEGLSTGDKLITDNGRWSNVYYLLDFHDYSSIYNQNNFQTLRIDITMKMREIDDGYQYLMLFTREKDDSSKIYDCQIEYYPGKSIQRQKPSAHSIFILTSTKSVIVTFCIWHSARRVTETTTGI